MNILIGLMLQALVVVHGETGDTRAICFPLVIEEGGAKVGVISEVNCQGNVDELIALDTKVIALQDGQLYRCGTPNQGKGAFVVTLNGCEKASGFRWWWE